MGEHILPVFMGSMPLIMKRRVRLVLLTLACCVLGGCHGTDPPITRELLVGSYTYVSKDPASGAAERNLDHLVLRSNGTYDLVQGGTTKTASEKKGVWRIEPGTPSDHVDVVLGRSGYPVEIKGNEVRLLVDLDVGIWWVKASNGQGFWQRIGATLPPRPSTPGAVPIGPAPGGTNP